MKCDPLLATTDLPVSLSVDDFYMKCDLLLATTDLKVSLSVDDFYIQSLFVAKYSVVVCREGRELHFANRLMNE